MKIKTLLITAFLISLLILPSILARDFYGRDSRGRPVVVRIKTVNRLELILRKLLSTTFAVISHPVEPGSQTDVTFYFTVSCPGTCTVNSLHYDIFNSNNVRVSSADVPVWDVDCYTSTIVDATFTAPTTPGDYTIIGSLRGVYDCLASSEDEGVFTVGSTEPDCSDRPCTAWSPCQDGVMTRTCYYSDCRTYLETRSCAMPTTTTIPDTCSVYTDENQCENNNCVWWTAYLRDPECIKCVPDGKRVGGSVCDFTFWNLPTCNKEPCDCPACCSGYVHSELFAGSSYYYCGKSAEESVPDPKRDCPDFDESECVGKALAGIDCCWDTYRNRCVYGKPYPNSGLCLEEQPPEFEPVYKCSDHDTFTECYTTHMNCCWSEEGLCVEGERDITGKCKETFELPTNIEELIEFLKTNWWFAVIGGVFIIIIFAILIYVVTKEEK